MTLGKVVGQVVSTVKHYTYEGEKILMVKPINPNGELKEKILTAIDKVQAGIGDTVLVLKEGNSSRQLMGKDDTPVNTIIVGIVDDIDFRKK